MRGGFIEWLFPNKYSCNLLRCQRTAADCMNTNQTPEIATGTEVGDDDNRFRLKAIKVAQVSLPHTSAVWPLVERNKKTGKWPHVSVFSDDIHDSVVVDADWLRDSAGEEKGSEAKVLAAALDAEPLCKGWRGFDLLYIHPQ